MNKIAVFAGSFDPFTIGHKNIVDRALALGYDVIVAVGVNVGKKTMFSVEERVRRIREVYAGNPHVTVTHYEGLTTDFARQQGANAILRGIRTVQDFEYERSLADINLQISGIDTLFLITEPKFSAISSSVVRELLNYGKDITAFIP